MPSWGGFSRLPTRCCHLEAGLVVSLEMSERPRHGERSRRLDVDRETSIESSGSRCQA